MSELLSLGYVGIGASDLHEWAGYATRLLGMQVDERSSTSLALRMDDRAQRMFVDEHSQIGPRFFGWEVADAAALNRLASRLETAGVAVTAGPAHQADRRGVAGLIAFHDPIGNRLEAFYGARISEAPFAPGRAISGFRTGPLGLGHMALTVERVEDVLSFYTDVLGFGLSDYSLRPFKAYFLHINARHHSLAIVETGVNGFHHLMIELFDLDDVGQGYDIAACDEGSIQVTLGRHSNDFMTSFYVRTPSDFMIEYGWGGRSIEPENWQPVECIDGPSLWGHDRKWLSPERRAEARKLALGAAAKGVRAPVQVMAGNHRLLPGVCPWWGGAIPPR